MLPALPSAACRADMRAALDDEPELTAAGLARRAYGSFATAWHVKRDFSIAGKKHLRSVSKGTFTSRRR